MLMAEFFICYHCLYRGAVLFIEIVITKPIQWNIRRMARFNNHAWDTDCLFVGLG